MGAQLVRHGGPGSVGGEAQGKETVVDDHYYEIIKQRSWYYKPGKNGRGYAVTTINRKPVYLHVYIFIMEHGAIPEGYDVDHIYTCDPLDNRVSNLRLADQCQNAQNRVVSYNKKSCRFKGVYLRHDKKSKQWVATIQANKVKYHIGFFDTAIEAAIAYNEWASKLHGEFCYLNVIPDDGDGLTSAR